MTDLPGFYVAAFIFGAMIGSFLNVCIYRIPQQKSVVFPASHCGACQKPVRWHDNLPVLSYFILRGKCRDCGASFSVQYALIEILTGFLFVLFFRYFGVTAASVVYLAFTLSLLVESMIDWRHKIIPDVITLPGMAVGLVVAALFPQIHDCTTWYAGFLYALIGLLTGGGFLYLVAIIAEKLMKKEAMGGGDIKLLAMIGAFLGIQGVAWSLFVGSLIGSTAGIYSRIKNKEEQIPFGPFLGLGAFLFIFFGSQVIAWYINNRLAQIYP